MTTLDSHTDLPATSAVTTAVPSGTWRMLSRGPQRTKSPKGLDAVWNTMASWMVPVLPRRSMLMRRAKRIDAMEAAYSTLTTEQLQEKRDELRAFFARGRDQREHLDHAFAWVREIARRELGMQPYLVQIASALAIESGCIAELATGEGKTLVATLPATVAGWRGRGCHVITVNDYLARRDAQWMKPIYQACGLRVAHIDGCMDDTARRAAYAADITYCTNKEVAADFLRDRLVLGRTQGLAPTLINQMIGRSGHAPERLVMRGLECAIIDEADSVLIDEAATPLIISGPAPNQEQSQAFAQAAALARQLSKPQDYRVNLKYREVRLTRKGREQAAILAKDLGGIWMGARRREELVRQALAADALYKRGDEYLVQEGKVVIVDAFTGRIMPDRTWREGMHQAIEAKEDLEINAPKDTLARISFQRFFGQYRRLAGMTGTAAEAWPEFWQVYKCPVVRIPTHQSCKRIDHRDRVFASAEGKWQAVVTHIQHVHEQGRPVLIGTRSIADSEFLSGLLTEVGLTHQVLNAVYHEQEAAIVAEAGKVGRITVSTNMAGRGTDIKLEPGVPELGGLYVIATERNESRRVDRQLAGRCARQGDPGDAIVFVSLKDELIQRHGLRMMRWIQPLLGHSTGEIRSPFARWLFTKAQHRSNGQKLRQRRGVLRYDDWLAEFLGFAGYEN